MSFVFNFFSWSSGEWGGGGGGGWWGGGVLTISVWTLEFRWKAD